MAIVRGIHPKQTQGHRHTFVDYPEIEQAEQDALFEKAARLYWQTVKNNGGDYGIGAEFLRENLTKEQRDSDRFRHIVEKRKPADA